MAKRIKMAAGITKEQFENAMGLLATQDALKEKKEAQMEIEINKIRDKYSPELTEITSEIEKQKGVVKTYCIENKKELFEAQRHINTVYGEVGFRLGTPAVKWLKDFTEDMVILKLKANGLLKAFVRNVEEVNKELLIAERDSETIAPLLEDAGIKIIQSESFFIKLKKEAAAA